MRTVIRWLMAACLGIFGVATVSAQRWQWQNPLPQGNSFHDVTFVDPNIGWAVGGCGTVYQTTDAGATWTRQSTGSTLRLNGVAFVNSLNGWAVGCDSTNLGGILNTTDGGQTWSRQTSPSFTLFSAVQFTAPLEGWIAAWGVLLHTTDGVSWDIGYLRPQTVFGDVTFTAGGFGWAIGYDYALSHSVIIHTTDSGVSWTPQLEDLTGTPYCVYAYDSLIAWVVGDGGSDQGQAMFSTTNGGTNWISHTWPAYTTFTDIHFYASPNDGWATHPYHGLEHTTNGGQNWSNVPLGSAYFTAFDFPSTATGIVTGAGGVMLRSTNAGADWTAWNQGPSDYLSGMCFLDTLTGWIASSSGTSDLLSTTNGGEAWTPHDVGVSSLSDVTFADWSHGWAVGNSAIVHTTDGGGSWHADTIFANHYHYLESICFANASTGWACGDSGRIWHTTDGTRWTSQSSGTNLELTDITFVDSQNLWAVGGDYSQGTIVHTSDGGLSWTAQYSGSVNKFQAVAFSDPLHGWALGSEVLHTTDGGTTWTPFPMPGNVRFWAITFEDTQHALAVGSWGTVFRTEDGGTNWSGEPSGTDNGLVAVAMSGDQAWAVGEFGTILHYGQPTSSHPADRSPRPLQWVLYQTYPNPFNTSATIAFDLPKASRISLRVFDLLGREVAVLKEGMMEAGTHRATFDGSNLTSGIYFARLDAGEFSQTKKLMLLK